MRRTSFLFTLLLIFLISAVFINLIFGSVSIPLKETFQFITGNNSNSVYFNILQKFRLPKTLTGILSGAALSVAGLQMQTFFRNPLAGPYVLGISSGASLGVALLLLSSLPFYIGNYFNPAWLTSISAGLGATAVLLLIFAVSVRVKDIMTVLIIGILIGSAISALVSLLQYFGSQSELKTFVVWTMGSLSGVNYPQLKILSIFVITGLLLSIFSYRILNLLLLGETYAKTSGLNTKTAGILIFAGTGILAGSVTAFCGPVGFIGVIVPHLSRMIFKTADHKILIPASAITGAILILLSDTIAQLPGYQGTLPVNTVTAILGIPVIIQIILKTKL